VIKRLTFSLFVIPFFTAPLLAGGPAISGYFESSYLYDFNRSSGNVVALRTFNDTGNSFYLNSAHLIFQGELQEGLGYTLEVDYGHNAQIMTGDRQVNLQEGYVDLPVGPFALTIGKFSSYDGIEEIEGPKNGTISRGYLFTYSEFFTYLGVAGHINVGNQWEFGLGVVNGNDGDVDNNNGAMVLWFVGYELGDPFYVAFSGNHGAVKDSEPDSNRGTDQLTTLDLTGTLSLIPRVPIDFQLFFSQLDNSKESGSSTSLGTIRGVGIQPTLEINNRWSVGARLEYIDNLDRENFNALNLTISPRYELRESISLRAELRQDWANSVGSDGPFVDRDGTLKDSSTTVALGIVYSF